MGCGACRPAKLPVQLFPSKAQSVENYIAVWYDGLNKGEKTKALEKQIQNVVKVVEKFNDPVQGRDFIEKVTLEKIFLIVSNDDNSKNFQANVQHFKQIYKIYVFCLEKQSNDPNSGAYTSMESLCKSLKEDTKQCDHDMIGYQIKDRTANSNRQKASDTHTQLL
ncbi:unnamed protein product [Adineta ricciae]|uniref:Uncharacterized protein n=1 Tax=Adineta ricciae TaxID=249248 RepID=A0A815C3V5_ADIRI|nr:unnamed protein product [Adineta ricciae]CAF1277829.1 unnamed protein product [Adineta ricciae]